MSLPWYSLPVDGTHGRNRLTPHLWGLHYKPLSACRAGGGFFVLNKGRCATRGAGGGVNGTDRGRCGGQIPTTTATGYGGIEIVPGGRRRFARDLLPLYRGAAARVRRQPLTDRSTDRLDKVSPERGVPFPSLPPSQLKQLCVDVGGCEGGPGRGRGGHPTPPLPLPLRRKRRN